MLRYCYVYLRNIKGIFTWHTDLEVQAGSLVVVQFRNTKRTGIIIKISEQVPKFKTQPVLEVWEKEFLPHSYLQLAQWIADNNYCGVEKVLSLMVPEKFHRLKNPIDRDISYTLSQKKDEEIKVLRGKKQKELVEKFTKNSDVSKIEESVLKKNFSTTVIKALLEKEIINKEIGSIKNPNKSFLSIPSF